MKTIFFVSPVRFTALFQRHQAFARVISKKGFRVIFIEPFRPNGLSCCFVDSSQPELKILQIKVPFVAREYAILQNLATRIAFNLMLKKLKPNLENSVLWIAEPSAACFTKYDFASIIYDCCDRHGFFPGQRTASWQNYEAEILKNADQIILTHQKLFEDLDVDYQKRAMLVGNATGFEKIQRKAKKPDLPLKVLSSGAHFEWIDFRWLKMLTDNEKIQLHIAGSGRGKQFEQLIKSQKVTYHNKLSVQKLEELCQKCDAGVIPFVESELTEAIDPIKAYDFAAAGLAVWSPDITGLRNNRLIDNRFNNIEGLEQAVNNRINFGLRPKSVPTWNDRIERILDITSLLG